MNIMSEWKDSLSLLKPANLKLFLLVTLNTLRQTFVARLRYSWPLIVLYSATALLFLFPPRASVGEVFKVIQGYIVLLGMILLAYQKYSIWLRYYCRFVILYLLLGILGYLFLFVNPKAYEASWIVIGILVLLVEFVIAMRPSVGLKNYEYFDQYVFHSIISVALLNGIWQLYRTLYQVLVLPHSIVLNSMLLLVIAMISTFMIMFFLDGKLSLKNLLCSIYRALKMFFYNFPFICLSLLLIEGLLLGFMTLFLYVVSWLHRLVNPTEYLNVYTVLFIVPLYLFFFCIVLFTICFFGNLYVKKSQEQYKLYFDK
ncbi:MAG TPA: hypothetical protein VGT41_02145 [Candidatus Babeliales bacterium]|nr:hypothetical protein [Candidatus Babeliales bacterium]